MMKEYKPKKLRDPERVAEVGSAWTGLERVIEDILKRFDIPRESALEFGVEFGYSTVALSNYFDEVVGVDHFEGDEHAGFRDVQHKAEKICDYDNIVLIKNSYQDYIPYGEGADLTHVDIVHNYDETYECGLWCARNSEITLFHDTESFPAVRKAVKDIADETNKTFYNYPEHYGLGIVV